MFPCLDELFQKIGNELRKVVKCMEAHSFDCWNCTMNFFFSDCCDSSEPSNIDSCGVGMEIFKNSEGLWHIVGIRPGGPADMARLSVGDEIVSVDFDLLSGLDDNEVKDLLFGKEGSAVTLEIIGYSDSEKKFVTLVRVDNTTNHSVHAGLARLVRSASTT